MSPRIIEQRTFPDPLNFERIVTPALKRSLLQQPQESTDEMPGRGWIFVLSIICLIAMTVSAYLAWVALTSSKIAGCGSGGLFDCGHVISSRWSLWMGVPVSLLSLALYALMAGALYISGSSRFRVPVRRAAWSMVTLFAFSAGMAACWFIGVQVFAIQHLCSYCMTAHACGLAAAGIVLWKKTIGLIPMKFISAIGVFGLMLLIGGQLISKPPTTYRIETFATPTTEPEIFEFEPPDSSTAEPPVDSVFEAPTSDDSDFHQGSMQRPRIQPSRMSLLAVFRPILLVGSYQSQAKSQKPDEPGKSDQAAKKDSAAERRVVSIIGGTVKLDVSKWPISGSQEAKYVFVEMFDYACPHCRKTHATIKGAAAKLGGNLAVITLPVPLNNACNNSILVTDPKFIESCEIAKLAVAVWRTDPSRFSEFHNWMFEGEVPRTFATAKAHAETLVDAKKLAAELNSDLPGKYVAKDVELYKRSGGGNVPKLMFPGTSIVGEFSAIDALADIIVREVK